jgi:hypothetical protein
MIINAHNLPFPHLIIDDFFASNEYDAVWHELTWLKPKLKERERFIADETDKAAQVKPQGLIIEELLQSSRRFSDTVLCTNKVFVDTIYLELTKLNPVFKYIHNLSSNATAVRLINHLDIQPRRRDAALFTALININKNSSYESGGSILFYGDYHEINLQDNQMIFFPAYLEYEVTETKFKDKEDSSFMLCKLMW